MNINANILKRATVHTDRKSWEFTRTKGVQRLRLDLVGNVKEVATSLLRIAPKTVMPQRVHAGGEEILVLEGVFQDEAGDYPVGSYIRNPPGTRHSPRSEKGCLLFSKYWQFDSCDRNKVNIDAYNETIHRLKSRPGVELQRLFGDYREDVRIERWAPDHRIELRPINGFELFVLEGSFADTATSYKQYSWLRLPPNENLKIITGDAGASVLVKEGHLVHAVPGRPAFRFPKNC